jgi:colicin import membrane protein
MEQVMSAVKTFETSDLFKLLKTTSVEVEKRSKTAAKASTGKVTAAKKTGSMPKGAIPPQLKKPRAWVEFTLKDALENGWESFTIVQKKKDKETNTVTEEQIEMPGSVLHDGAHIYKDSVTEEKPAGKQLIHKDAMSLSKQRKESSHSSYSLFESSYVDTPSDDDKSDAGSSTASASKKIVVKKTAAEKEAEAAVKKAEKALETAAKKEAKALETAAKKEAKALEAAAKKAEKEAEKEAKKAEKETSKSVVKAPVAAVKKAAPAPAPAPAEPVAEKPVAKKPTRKVAKIEDVPSDGMVHPWTYKSKKYLRNADGETWTVGADGGMGNWVGVYDAKAGLIKGAPEPVFDNDE